MEHAFVVRLASSDRDAARRVVSLIERGLAARGARVVREGEPGPRVGTTFRLSSATTEAPGLVALVGLGADDVSPAWLPPLPLSQHPEDAAFETLAFLERWGFI